MAVGSVFGTSLGISDLNPIRVIFFVFDLPACVQLVLAKFFERHPEIILFIKSEYKHIRPIEA